MNLTSENEKFFDSTLFSKMKKRPFLINVARGGIIDEDALVTVLDRGILFGAGLDVLSSESPDLKSCRLLNRDNVVLTLHAAYFSDDSVEAGERISAENISHFLNGDLDKVFKLV